MKTHRSFHPLALTALLICGLSTFASAQSRPSFRPGLSLGPTGTIALIGQVDTGSHDLIGSLAGAMAASRAGKAETARARKQETASWTNSIDYSGPRFGITYLPQAAIDSLKNHGIDAGPAITQFGWQVEREIHVSPEGPRVLNEWVFLIGGLERGIFLPSATWLIGVRDRSGTEFGVGPNVSVAGVALAAAAGVTVHSGGLNFPMNVAVASSKGGVRLSFLTGFTLH